MTAARTRRRGPRGTAVRRGGDRPAAGQRSPGLEDRVGRLRARGGLELHRGRSLRLASPAGEPDRRADGAPRLRLVSLRARLRECSTAVLVRVRHRRAVGRGLPAARHDLPVGPAGARLGPRAGHRRLSRLHRGLDPRDAVRRAARAGMRRLPDQRPADPPGPRSREPRHRPAGRALRRPLRDRPRSPRSCAGDGPASSSAFSSRRSTSSGCSPSCSRRPRSPGRATPRDGPRSPPRRCCPLPSWSGCCAATWRAWTPTCARAWTSCAPPERGSWRRVTPSAGASSAICTTAHRRGSWASPCCWVSRAGASTRTPRRPGS